MGFSALSIIDPIAKLLDKLIPDPLAREAAKLELLKQERQADLQELQISMSAILAEAQSIDPWTSRARPSFLYVFYILLFSLIIVAPLFGIWFPEQMDKFFANVARGFSAIPEPMWWTFSAGYLGYTGARTYEKKIKP